MKKIIFLGSLIFALSGCEKEAKIETCWSQQASSAVTALAKEEILDAIMSLQTDKPKDEKRDERLKNIASALTVKVDTFAAKDSNPRVGSLLCTSNVSFEFNGAGGKIIKAGPAGLEFNAYRGEKDSFVFNLSNSTVLRALVLKAE